MQLKLLSEGRKSSLAKSDKLSKICRYITSSALSVAATLYTTKWVIPAAAQERGYSGAIGGEIIVIAFVGISVFCLINWMTQKGEQ